MKDSRCFLFKKMNKLASMVELDWEEERWLKALVKKKFFKIIISHLEDHCSGNFIPINAIASTKL